MPAVSQCISPFVRRHRKVIVFTSPLLAEYVARAIESAGIPCFPLGASMKPAAVRKILDAFEGAECGVLLSAIGRPVGWHSTAGAMLFLQCSIHLDRPQLAEALQSAAVQEIHYMHCLFSASNIAARFAQLGIATVPSDRLFQPVAEGVAHEVERLAAC